MEAPSPKLLFSFLSPVLITSLYILPLDKIRPQEDLFHICLKSTYMGIPISFAAEYTEKGVSIRKFVVYSNKET